MGVFLWARYPCTHTQAFTCGVGDSCSVSEDSLERVLRRAWCCGRDRLISQLELQNRKTMRQISQRLGDLSAETDHKADS